MWHIRHKKLSLSLKHSVKVKTYILIIASCKIYQIKIKAYNSTCPRSTHERECVLVEQPLHLFKLNI